MGLQAAPFWQCKAPAVHPPPSPTADAVLDEDIAEPRGVEVAPLNTLTPEGQDVVRISERSWGLGPPLEVLSSPLASLNF